MQTAEDFMWGGLRPRFERWSTVHPRSLAQHFAVVPQDPSPRTSRGIAFPAVKPEMRRDRAPHPARSR
ncbi:MAG TPA: hypothetical protein VH650_05100 [Gaiellaceae bacterium]|jgi:hypothetical protein